MTDLGAIYAWLVIAVPMLVAEIAILAWAIVRLFEIVGGRK